MGKKEKGKCWIGFDLGGTKMLAKAYDETLKELGRSRTRTKANLGMASGLERIAGTIHAALAAARLSKKDVDGIGIGCPGPLNLEKGILLSPPNLGWKDVPLKAALEAEFGCPAFVLNDVDAGVYGEYYKGAAQKARCVVGVFPGTGIGGGCVYEGKIIRGKRHSCFEIGHIQVQPDGPLCGCGRRGCLEAVASRLAISSAVAVAAFRGLAPHIQEVAGTDLARIRSSVLAGAIQAGDKVVEQIVRDAAGWLGVGIGSVINLMGPEVVVIGGGLVEAMPELFLTEVKRSAGAHVMPAFENTFEVAVAKLGDDAAVIGAAAWAQQAACAASV